MDRWRTRQPDLGHAFHSQGLARQRLSVPRGCSVAPLPESLCPASEATATTEMSNLPYDEMDKLTPYRVCGSCRYRFDREVWQCWSCIPPPSADMIRIDLNARVI
jgi:hypothetical protein